MASKTWGTGFRFKKRRRTRKVAFRTEPRMIPKPPGKSPFGTGFRNKRRGTKVVFPR